MEPESPVWGFGSLRDWGETLVAGLRDKDATGTVGAGPPPPSAQKNKVGLTCSRIHVFYFFSF